MNVRTASIGLLCVMGLLQGCVSLPGMAFNKSVDRQKDDASGWFHQDEAVVVAGTSEENLQVDAGEPAVHAISPQLILRQSEFASAQPQQAASSALGRLGGEYVYKIGPRDILTIVVWGHPELTIPAGEFRSEESSGRRVRADGTIFFPFVGIVRVDGQSVDQVRRKLTSALRPYVRDPQVDVRVAAYRSKKIYITGQVNNPGTHYITDEGPSLMQMLNQAGGLNPAADQRVAQLTRGDRQYSVDLDGLYQSGSSAANISLEAGDTLFVPDNRATRVFVMGEVGKQQALPMVNGRLSLADAIADVEGLKFDTAELRGIYVIRGVQKKNSQSVDPQIDLNVFQLNLSSPDALVLADQFNLQPRDVVFVSATKLARWNLMMSQVLPTVQALFQTTAFIRNID